MEVKELPLLFCAATVTYIDSLSSKAKTSRKVNET